MQSFSDFLIEGSSKGTQFNTELASLLACCSNKVSDFSYENVIVEFGKFENRFSNFSHTMELIELHLSKHYDESQFSKFYASSVKLLKSVPGLKGITLDWVAEDVSKGSERDPSDVVFVGDNFAGISVKASSSVTLANLTPKSLGIETKGDIFEYFNKDTYALWKSTIISGLLEEAKKKPGEIITPDEKRGYNISYNEGEDNFILSNNSSKNKMSKKPKIVTANELLVSGISSNTAWKKVFGSYFLNNKDNKEIRKLTKELYNSVAEVIFSKITDAMIEEKTTNAMMGIITKPYYYLNDKYLYKLPSREELGNKLIFKVSYDEVTDDSKSVTGMKFKCIGKIKGAKEEGSFEIQIRYADGVFASSPTVRVQSSKNLQHLGWTKLS